MRHGVFFLLVGIAVAGQQGSLGVILRQEPTTLQEKTITAIENLSLVLGDLKESMRKENAATPTGTSPSGDAEVAVLEGILRNLTLALQNNTMALHEARIGDETYGGTSGCEMPYWRLGKECFYVNQHMRVSWSEARIFCRGLGGDLAQPQAVIKLRAALLLKYPEDYQSFYWLGASESGGMEGNWRWLSGGPVRADEWARDQPDGGNENCIVLSRDEYPSLHDSPCYTHTTFICQANNTIAARPSA